MSNYLQRLAARSSATVPLVRPQIGPIFGLASGSKLADLESAFGNEISQSVQAEESRRSIGPGVREGRYERPEVSALTGEGGTNPFHSLDSASAEEAFHSAPGRPRPQKPFGRVRPAKARKPTNESAQRANVIAREPHLLQGTDSPAPRLEFRSDQPHAFPKNRASMEQHSFSLAPSPHPQEGEGIVPMRSQRLQPVQIAPVNPRAESVASVVFPDQRVNFAAVAVPQPFRRPNESSSFLPPAASLAEPEPTVEVSIARVEVRLISSQTRPSAVARGTSPKIGLEEYLRRRSQGGRP